MEELEDNLKGKDGEIQDLEEMLKQKDKLLA